MNMQDDDIRYWREKPCCTCDQHWFYTKTKKCVNCQYVTSAEWRKEALKDDDYRENKRQYEKQWRKDNALYLKAYEAARYQLRKAKLNQQAVN